MLIEKIEKLAKNGKVMVFCDMDGVLVEYDGMQKHAIETNVPFTYLNNRPLKSVISQIKKLNKIENVELAIMSSCWFDEQKQEKLAWLNLHANFFKPENVHIIVYNNEVFDKEKKHALKAKKILEIIKDKKVFPVLIEDNHSIIKETNKLIKNCAVHVSEIIE